MEKNPTADPKTLNPTPPMDSPSLETLEFSFGNLRFKNSSLTAGSPSPSPLPFPSPSPLPGPSSPFHLNAYSGYQPYNLFLNPTALNNPVSGLSNVGLSGGFPKQNPFLPCHPQPLHPSVGLQSSLQRNGIINMALTKQGSEYLQELLASKDPTITKLVFEGVFEYLFLLMTNQFGRYLFQKLIESGLDRDQMKMIVGKLTGLEGHIFNASVDRFGCYSVKKLIKVLEKSPLITDVVRALSNNFHDLMVDPTGQYVIMECLDNLDSQKNDLLYVEAIKHCLDLATNERGCIALNSFISRIKGPRRDQLMNFVRDHAVYLALHPSGNYAVQCVLELHNLAINESICRKLKGYYVRLSLQKGGSHLVEKCLNSSGMEVVVLELIQSNQLLQIAKDRYGNYVIQRALEQTKRRNSKLYATLVGKLQPYANSLLFGFGRNIGALITASSQFNRA